jgi:vancomycin resistance protein VanJ
MTIIRRGRRLAIVAAIGWVAAVLGLLVVHLILPQRNGPLALTLILEPYLVASALVVTPLLFTGRRIERVAVVVVLLAVTVVRYGPVVVSLPPPAPADAQPVRAVTWNLQAWHAPDEAIAVLGSSDADLVALQELTPAVADALSADPGVHARFPHLAFAPESTVLGIGLLSRYPVLEHETWIDPPMIRAVIAPLDSPAIGVVVAHPLPGRFTSFAGLPLSLDTTRRDASIARIRAVIDGELATGRPVVALGDFNVTEREPAYAELSRDLHDAHLDAGLGPGFTWRPTRFQSLPFGLLRIDYLFASPPFVTLAADQDCQPRGSDHCILSATFARPDS